MTISTDDMLALLSALIVAAAIISLSIWLVGMQINHILGASTWVVALIFFGLAVDNGERLAILQALTGTALLVLAWFQNTVSADYFIVAAVFLAMWAAVGIFTRLK